MKNIAVALILVVVMSMLSGCARSPVLDWAKPAFARPPKNEEQWFVSLARAYKREPREIKDLYDDATDKARRNMFISRTMIIIDEYHENWKVNLQANKAFQKTFFDTLIIGLTAAGTVFGGEGVKTALSASAVGIQGTSLAINRNFFLEKTISAIVSQMDANRNEYRRVIEEKRSTIIAEYSKEDASADLLRYFYAGSLVNALSSMADDAAVKKVVTAERSWSDFIENRLSDRNRNPPEGGDEGELSGDDSAEVGASETEGPSEP